MKKQLLHKNWTLWGEKTGTAEAKVPGCVHTDLLRCGMLPDYFWRDNNDRCQWIENEDFTYTCTFEAQADSTAVLVFEGLDTYCDVFLNGQKLGEAHNMFIPHEFPAGHALKNGENQLRVAFRSPIKEVAHLPLRKGAFTRERINSRRMQCTYGWDWVDRFVTCGIHGPVYLRTGCDMYPDSVYIVTENIDAYSAQLMVRFELKNHENGGLAEVEILSPEGEVILTDAFFAREPARVRRYDIEEPRLWYPRGYGEHPVYTLRVTVGENRLEETFGIRTVKLLQLPDKPGSEAEALCRVLRQDEVHNGRDRNEAGSGFQIIVNGQKVLALGGNWVPAEPFPSEQTPGRTQSLLERAAQMGVNMLRVWGGGRFESREFFDGCDRLGIMVTQDFLMACGQYPEEQAWFIEELKKEAEHCVRAIRSHPCLVWYSGDNELGAHGSDTMETYKGRTAAMEAAAPAVYRHDPCRPFLPSSPCGGDEFLSPTVGTMHNTLFLKHIYGFFNNTDCSFYQQFLQRFGGRFVCEEPVFSMASDKALLRFMTREDLLDPSEAMLEQHTRNHPALPVSVFQSMTAFAKKIMAPRDEDAKRFAYRYIGYEWTRVVMENLRRRLGFMNGMVFWMYNDCWPAALSWSFVDYYGSPKASFYAFRRCAKALTLSVAKDGDGYRVTASNCRHEEKTVSVRVTALDKRHGFRTAAEDAVTLTPGAYATAEAALSIPFCEDYVIVCDGGEDRACYVHDRPFIRQCNELLQVTRDKDGSVTLRASGYVHAVELDTAALCSENYFSLLPGEEKTVTRQGDDEVTVRAYTLV